MRAILHIGTEKTGTTAIQSFLHLQRTELAKLGFHVLESAGQRNHRWIPTAAMDGDRGDDFTRSLDNQGPEVRAEKTATFLEAFDAEVSSLPSGTHTVIMTSEHLHSRLVRQPEIDRVGDLMEKYFENTNVVCYLRRQIDVCTSLYSTLLKNGQHMSLSQFIDHCHPGNLYYDYSTILDMWERRFGYESLSVRLFERQNLFQNDLLDDFCRAVEPNLVGRVPKEADRRNESLTPTGQALARAVNRELNESEDLSEHERKLRQKALRLIDRHFSGRGEQPSPEDWHRVNASFVDINDRVRGRWFPEISGELFESDNWESPIELPGENLFQVLTQLFSLIRSDRP